MAGYIIRDREKTLALPARQVDQLLAAADGDAALLYLYLMRAEDAVTAEQLMEKLSMSALRLQGAQTKLEKMGLIQAQGLPLPEPEIGDTLRFDNTGAYCVTEGIALFLSRDLPAVYLVNPDGCITCARETTETYPQNMPNRL